MIRHLVLFFSILCIAATGQTYFQAYPNEVEAVRAFKARNQKILDSVFNQYHVDEHIAFSIVAPEIGHYSIWQDRMEVSVVTLFYTEMGTDYNDFSIGYFQMKAAFAEQVEQYVSSLSLTPFHSLLKYKHVDGRSVREERVNRMLSVAHQCVYLAAFLTICKHLHPDWFASQAETVSWLANAYNFGFWNSIERINGWGSKKNFPRSGKNAFSYANVSLEYFKNLR